MRTLLADDNNEIRDALRLLLKELGEMDIVEASDMSEAFAACLGGEPPTPPDLVLLDWELPAGGCRQLDAAAFVAALREAASGCRIIAMSAHLEAEQQSLDAGCDAFVSLTDPPDRLVRLVLGAPGAAGA